MNKNQALAAIAEIESLIGRFGSPDKDALHTIKTKIFALHGADSYFNEKLGSLEGWAKIGFSTRKFENYSGGLEQVRVHALSDCMMLQRLISEWPES
ncbi:MAG: hypothetical protein ACREA9_18575 [Pyrinomonadaceae bacterium]